MSPVKCHLKRYVSGQSVGTIKPASGIAPVELKDHIKSSNLSRCLIYLIDLVIDNLLSYKVNFERGSKALSFLSNFAGAHCETCSYNQF